MQSFHQLIQSPKPILVDFFATWCGPCKMMQPVLKELKETLGDAITIVKIDVDKQQNIAAQHQIQSMPTLLLFQNGEVKWRQSGVMTAALLKRVLQPFLA